MIKQFLAVTAVATTAAALLMVTGCDDDFDCHGQSAPGTSLELVAQPLKPTAVPRASNTSKTVTRTRPTATVVVRHTTHHYHGC